MQWNSIASNDNVFSSFFVFFLSLGKCIIFNVFFTIRATTECDSSQMCVVAERRSKDQSALVSNKNIQDSPNILIIENYPENMAHSAAVGKN